MKLLAVVPVALLTVFPGPVSGQTSPLDGLDTYIRNAMADWQIPGLAIAVVKDDSVVFLHGFGVRQVGSDARVDEHTVFEFGSTTKAFTATAMAMLVSDGKLAWDDPVHSYVPWLEFADPFVTRSVTIRDLLSHRVADGWVDAENFMLTAHTPREILRAMAWRPPPGATPLPANPEPGAPAPLGSASGVGFRARFAYNNANYYAAAEVIAAVTGARWEEFIRSRIFGPLGMATAQTSVYDVWQRRAVAPCTECGVGDHVVTLDDALIENVAVRHRNSEHGPVTTAAWPLDNNPAGGIMGSIDDAARWLRFQTAGGAFDGRRLLEARAFDETHSPQVSKGPRSGRDFGLGGGTLWAYGFGWHLTDYHGRKASFHGGGFLGFIGILHEEHLGVMVLANVPSDLREALVYRVFDAFVDVPPRDWSGELLEAARSRRARAVAARATRPVRPTVAAPLPLSAYVGTYSHPALGDFIVALEDGALVGRFEGGQIEDMVSLGANEFLATGRGPIPYSGAVTFTVRGTRAVELTLRFPGGRFTRK